MDPPLTTSYFQLAMAALVGASLMAVSAFYIHKRTVDQVLDRVIEIRRKSGDHRSGGSGSTNRDDEEEEGEGDYKQLLDGGEDESEYEERGLGSEGEVNGVRKRLLSSSFDSKGVVLPIRYPVSSSMPNVAVGSEWFEDDARFDEAVRARAQGLSASSLDKLNFVPSGLPPIQLSQRKGEDQPVNRAGSNTRVASVGRLITPRSSGVNAFESIGDSDDDTELANDEDVLFSLGNVDSTPEILSQVDLRIQSSSVVPFTGDTANCVQDQNLKSNGCEEKTAMHGKEAVDTSPVHVVGNDTTFADVLPQSILLHGESANVEEEEVRKMICECLDLRKKYVYNEEVAPWRKVAAEKSDTLKKKSDPFHFEPVEATAHHFRIEDGVVHVYASENDTVELFPVASSTEFFTDMHHLLKVMSIGNVRSACHHRLRFLEEKFRLYLLINADKEFLAQKSAPHRDFYNIRKVDTHVHHSACMNQKHLLRFIKSKLRKEPDEATLMLLQVVIFRDGKYMTLKEVFESLDLTGYDMNVDLLDVHADKSTFHRFDKFNLKYNPCGQSRLREIFLKQDNLIQGRFLAEVTKQVLSDLEASKYQMAEYRISIYGRKQSEWDQLASWFVNNEIYSENAVWLIQLPRLYNVYKGMGIVKSFQNILDNVFIPLFEVTINPNSHPQLHLFLMQVVGFDLVDDESKPERRPKKHMDPPAEWTNDYNPAYSYYAYYCYANLYTLNKLRESKGMTTIKLRPHCGEAGDIDHLAAGFLLCTNISHGINLRKSPVLQYLYYLAQIGLAMSPLSNNSLFLDYHRNPFPAFFQRGLNVSLSSDDPLQIHLTKEALVEEYSVAAQVWKLSACDLCEIARNSVYQSGFSHEAKLHWLGDGYFIRGPEGNDIHKTNVANMRIAFRHERCADVEGGDAVCLRRKG
ncbi:probable AMP deaminase isoform X2 [Carica papaya]|uniref:probable AMP deaminase isoform X2 n=1 Tax=Carica papaya TaxID=3649 RepID=UPI000B8CE1C9|nr:probable AMP deaminase isoform X2 [Carica papaya]